MSLVLKASNLDWEVTPQITQVVGNDVIGITFICRDCYLFKLGLLQSALLSNPCKKIVDKGFMYV